MLLPSQHRYKSGEMHLHSTKVKQNLYLLHPGTGWRLAIGVLALASMYQRTDTLLYGLPSRYVYRGRRGSG